MLYFIRLIILICCLQVSFANKFIAGVNLYVLVSSSMPKRAIHALSYTGRKVDMAMLFRGLIDGSWVKTTAYIGEISKKTKWGATLYPKIFADFKVEHAPCFILAEMDITDEIKRFDKICGNLTLDYVLEEFANRGDMQLEAKVLLKKLRSEDVHTAS